jgi:DNA-binding XRE family transcriptional regulator/mannose-6-phosphate isomerase-like protein (cupin superfamily)
VPGSDEAGGSSLEAIIGERVRQYRQAASLSSAELAVRAGMSRAMVSRVESATTSSSLSTLQRLAEGLGIPVTALFRGVDSEREAVFTPAGHGALTVRSGTRHGHEYHSLGHLRGTGETALEPTLVTLTEASMVFPLFQHPGQEFLYVLQGSMVYAHGAYRYPLGPGDSLLIDGEGPHGPLQLVDLPVRFLAIAQHQGG